VILAAAVAAALLGSDLGCNASGSPCVWKCYGAAMACAAGSGWELPSSEAAYESLGAARAAIRQPGGMRSQLLAR